MGGRTPANIKDYIGRKFGKLTVLGMSYRPAPETTRGRKNHKTLWHCLCDCGKEIYVPSSRITNRVIGSCGCARHRPPGESGLLRIYNGYRNDARKRKRIKEFTMTFDEFKPIVVRNCTYCGCPPSREAKIPGCTTGYSSFYYNGLDRIDPAKGYVLGNVVPCCTKCNMMKWVLSKEEFLEHVEKIYKFNRIPLSKRKLILPTLVSDSLFPIDQYHNIKAGT